MNDSTSYRIINLASGDNIIGQVINKESKTITVYRPYQMKIITMMDSAGPHHAFRQEALVMRNWLELSTEEHVTIDMANVIAITSPTDKVTMHYEEEKEKEDNPLYMQQLLDKINSDAELDDLEESPFLGEEDHEVTIDIEQTDLSDIIKKIMEDVGEDIRSKMDNKPERDLNQENDEYYDTDKDMFGW